jgi:hypothetical protein
MPISENLTPQRKDAKDAKVAKENKNDQEIRCNYQVSAYTASNDQWRFFTRPDSFLFPLRPLRLCVEKLS